jgi:hypothetical protein
VTYSLFTLSEDVHEQLLLIVVQQPNVMPPPCQSKQILRVYLKHIEQLILPLFEPASRESEQKVGLFDSARICSITFTDNENVHNFIVHWQALYFKQIFQI